MFAKLTKIKIPTLYKKYNSDFAYLIEKENYIKLFLIFKIKVYSKKNEKIKLIIQKSFLNGYLKYQILKLVIKQ